MKLIDQLSSEIKDKNGNYNVAALCLENKTLLAEIAEGLMDEHNKIVIDCAEVFTEVAKDNPEWVIPYADQLPQILNNKNNRARWEAMHCLALIASHTPQTIQPILDQLVEIIDKDKSVIVRDYAIDTIGNFAKTSIEAAQSSYPLLADSLLVWEGRHAKQVISGFINIAELLPEKKEKMRATAQEYLSHKKGVIRKLAKKLLQKTEKN
ncbi:MAG: hypothetical protein JEZ06_10915 [Anaerolineaceae bacterium]|nr:hypothetical protein [Anaerolineaceae bacterium]